MINDAINIINKQLNEVKEGNECAVQLFVDLRKLENFLKDAKFEIEPYAFDELQKHEKGIKVLGNYEVTYTRARKKYNYDNVSSIVQLKDEYKDDLKRLQDLAKRALNNLAANIKDNVVDEDTGEIINACSLSYTKESIALKERERNEYGFKSKE